MIAGAAQSIATPTLNAPQPQNGGAGGDVFAQHLDRAEDSLDTTARTDKPSRAKAGGKPTRTTEDATAPKPRTPVKAKASDKPKSEDDQAVSDNKKNTDDQDQSQDQQKADAQASEKAEINLATTAQVVSQQSVIVDDADKVGATDESAAETAGATAVTMKAQATTTAVSAQASPSLDAKTQALFEIAKPTKPAADDSANPLNLISQAGAEPPAKTSSNAQATAPTLVAPPPQPDATDVDPNVARVARGLQNAVSQGGGSVTLRLQPPELGLVRIEMEVRNGVTNVKFQTEEPSARDILSHQLASLKQSLESQGLTVDKLEVHTMPTTPTAGFSQDQLTDNSPNNGRSAGQFFTQQQQQGGGSQDDAERRAPSRRSFEEAMVNVVG